MLTGKQKRYLRSLAVNEKSLFQIGKDGLTDNLLITIKQALKARELVKINLLKTCTTDIDEITQIICTYTRCELVQVIGKTIVLYKHSRDGKIILP